jgi:hypothetical protein
MPPTVHRIDSFFFNVMRGPIGKYHDEVEVVSRAGVDGTLLRQIGKRGTPFRVDTWRDVFDLATGRSTFNQYSSLIGSGPVDITWSGYAVTGNENLKVHVLSVDVISLASASRIANAFSTNSGAILTCAWQLLFEKPDDV